MKALTVFAAALALSISAACAQAELCPACKGKTYTTDIGKCQVCGGNTSSKMFKLCPACSAKLKQCEHCGGPLTPRPKIALGAGAAATRPSAGPGALPATSRPTSASASRPASQPASQPAEKIDLLVTDADEGKTVSATVGQKVVIRIPSEGPGPRPPPQWTAKFDGNSLRLEGEILLRAKTVAGPGGLVGVQQGGPMVAEAVFLATKACKTTITLEARPFGKPDAAPKKTFAVTVEVKAGEAASKPS